MIWAGRYVHFLFLDWAVQLKAQGNEEIIEVNLCGACAMASWVLCKVLRDLGEEPVFCYSNWETHSWVEWNGWVLDPTATQFNRRHRKLRYLKINSRKWKKDMYTERWAGLKALKLCNSSMSPCSPREHRTRLETMAREIVAARRTACLSRN